MKMHPTDIWIYENKGSEVFVVASILSFGMEWPRNLNYVGKVFQFQTNEVMEDWMIGEYGGHAKYIEITE
jgi:hypothetical protein